MGSGNASQQAIDRIRELEALKRELQNRLRRLHRSARSQVEAQIEELDQRINNLRTTAQNAITASGLVNRENLNTAAEGAGTLIDAYLRVYGQRWSGDLVDIQVDKMVPVYGPLRADLGVSCGLGANVSVARSGVGLTLSGAATGDARVALGVGTGVELPFVGGYAIAGGVQGGASVEGSIQFTLEAERSGLKASITPFTFALDMVAELYIRLEVSGMSESDLEDFFSKLKALSSNIDVSGARITYELGRLNLFEITTKSYSLTFTIERGRYVYGSSSGNYSAQLNPALVNAIREVIQSIKQAARDFLSSFNPF